MDDTISRQAAIDAFLTELTKRERNNLLHTWSTVEVKYFVADMLEKLPSAQQEQRWIPCSERLPKPFEYCLWTTTDGRVIYHHWDGMYSKYTAWMPLPEPYEEGKDG